jgi:hypothetical protein
MKLINNSENANYMQNTPKNYILCLWSIFSCVPLFGLWKNPPKIGICHRRLSDRSGFLKAFSGSNRRIVSLNSFLTGFFESVGTLFHRNKEKRVYE